MASLYFLSSIFLLFRLTRAQTTFPQSEDYVSYKFSIPEYIYTSYTYGSGGGDMLARTLTIEAQPGVSGQNEGFVTAKNTTFYLHDQPWFCVGTNAYYGALKYIMSDKEVPVMMQSHASKGANVLRIFAFSNFNSVPDPIMPELGVYNEDALKRLDLTLAAAAQNGIRLIMTLSNYWPFLGSKFNCFCARKLARIYPDVCMQICKSM